MPKIIDGIRQNIIISARGILLACGYRGLTIRAVASECGIATGTVYNYFSNKENLAACVMLDDWLAALGRMRDGCDRAAGFREGLGCICAAIGDFRAKYSAVWEKYTPDEEIRRSYPVRHRMLIFQLAQVTDALMLRCGVVPREGAAVFLAENLLTLAYEGYEFDSCAGFLCRAVGAADEAASEEAVSAETVSAETVSAEAALAQTDAHEEE